MSRSRISRPPATKLMLRRSSSDSNAPVTRSSSFSSPVWITPAGLTTFCACNAAISAERSMPRPASCSIENSTIHALILRAEHLDLRDIRHQQQLRADLVDVIAQFALVEPIGGEAVDDAIGIAELVVEAGADDAGRQRVTHVADALAHVVPDVRHLAGRRRALQVDEDRGLARAGVAAQEIQVRGFLQRALQPLGHLLQRVVDRGTGPCRLHHHRLDDEGGVLVAAKAVEGRQPRQDGRDHQIDDEGAVPQRPLRDIEAHV